MVEGIAGPVVLDSHFECSHSDAGHLPGSDDEAGLVEGFQALAHAPADRTVQGVGTLAGPQEEGAVQ